ncbi:MAG: hypothetical protein J6K96_04015 [Treponema sp.]|nr:hypothetical protein [Treponema sp.]
MTFEDFIKKYDLENGGYIETNRFFLRKNKEGSPESAGPSREDFSVEKRGEKYVFITKEISKTEKKIELFEKDCIVKNYKGNLSLFFLSCNEAGDIELNILSDIVNPKQNK